MKGTEARIAIAVFLGSLVGGVVGAPPSRNQLFKVFHHRVEVEPGSVPFLELGKLIFSFSAEPKIDLINNANSGEGWQRAFFFPMTEIANAECTEMLQAITRNSATPYKITFEIIDKPVQGIRFTFAYDQKKIGMTYTIMESVGEQKRLIVTFYDKYQIRRIKNAQEAVLRTACQDRKPGVIVDIGHGGFDYGARGCFDISEKDINLEVGVYVANLLRKKGFDVFLTRSSDVAVALDERTVMTAQNKAAAILVSIHTNAASNINASGIETFFFDVSCYCMGTDKQACLTKTLLHDRCGKSQQLACNIHQSILSHAKHKQSNIVDRGVKQSFLQVLVGSSVPSALVELGFLTNQKEAALIKDKQYKLLLATGICEGIIRYFEQA